MTESTKARRKLFFELPKPRTIFSNGTIIIKTSKEINNIKYIIF